MKSLEREMKVKMLALSRRGGHARKAALTPEQLRVIALAGVAGRKRKREERAANALAQSE